MKRRLRALVARARHAGWRRAGWSLAVLGLFAASVLFDLHENKLLPDHECTYQQEQHDSEFEKRLYGPLVLVHGFLVRHLHKTADPKVAIVTISSPSEPLEATNESDRCKGRSYIAKLVRALDALGPKVITIDKIYANGSCDNTDNKPFVMALRCTRAPVIVGQSTDHTASRNDAKQDCLVSVDSFAFNDKATPGHDVQLGLTRLNANSLKIPVAWYVQRKESDSEIPEPGLALLTAEAVNRNLRRDPQMRWALGDLQLGRPQSAAKTVIRQPIGALVDIKSFSASTILRAVPAAEDLSPLELTACPALLPGKSFPGITGKAVVIGQLSDDDREPTPEGFKAGVELQASYVSNLLEHQTLRTVPRWLELTVLGGFFLMTYLIELRYEGEAKVLLGLWCGGFAVLFVMSLVAFALNYMTPIFLSASWLLFSLILFRVFSVLRGYSSERAGFLRRSEK